MTDYKLVPVKSTQEMLEAGKYALEAGCYASGIYADMLSEAPVINIVATKNEQGQIVSVTLQDEDHHILEVIAEADVQQPAEQQSSPDVGAQILSLISDECRYWQGRDEARRGGYAILYAKAKELISKQKPAPDVDVPEIIEAVANFVGSQEGGPFTPAVIKAAIISQLNYGDAFTKLFTSPTPSHSQQSEEVGVSELVEALEELVDLMEDTRQGEYIPDSFTTQPARIALAAHRKGVKM